jgi:hypothetical protein
MIRALVSLVLALMVWGMARPAHAADAPSARVLDAFEDIAPWRAGGSDDVRASVHPAEGVRGQSLRLDFDLAGTAG